MFAAQFFLTILLCGVSNMVIGFLWYSPMLFGNAWAKMMGMKDMSKEEMKKTMPKIYGLSFLTAMLTAFFLSLFLRSVEAQGSVISSLNIAFFIWLGFVTTTQFTNWLFSKKPFTLFLIDTGYQLVAYLAMSTIIVFLF
jgi:hypothetical protein